MPNDNQPGGAETMRDVPVDWEALEDAFENNAPEVHSYLHIATGEVLRVVDGIADPEMHSRISTDSTYLRIEPVSSREQYRWMERFIQMVDDDALKEALTGAIDGKGAFRRFKDVLMAYGTDRERWFAFRSERLRVFMEAWLTAHALQPVARRDWSIEAEADGVGEVPDAQSAPRRPSGGASGLRRQLRDIAEQLGPRELDKVLAFAEFVMTRRSSSRPPAEDAANDDAEGADAPSDAEPPSSRKLATR